MRMSQVPDYNNGRFEEFSPQESYFILEEARMEWDTEQPSTTTRKLATSWLKLRSWVSQCLLCPPLRSHGVSAEVTGINMSPPVSSPTPHLPRTSPLAPNRSDSPPLPPPVLLPARMSERVQAEQNYWRPSKWHKVESLEDQVAKNRPFG